MTEAEPVVIHCTVYQHPLIPLSIKGFVLVKALF